MMNENLYLTSNKYKVANKHWPCKYPRFGKYVYRGWEGILGNGIA